MGNKKVVNSSVADRSSYNIHVIHDKKPATLDDLIEAENGKPVLVMYAYQHDLTRIQQRFGKYDPENPTDVRELNPSADLEDWNAGKIPVAVAKPASTGHGLSLQHGGSTIVCFGLNRSLELYEQANARQWRQGQKETVVVHHLVVKGTMDEHVMRAKKLRIRMRCWQRSGCGFRALDSTGRWWDRRRISSSRPQLSGYSVPRRGAV